MNKKSKLDVLLKFACSQLEKAPMSRNARERLQKSFKKKVKKAKETLKDK